MAGRCNPLGWAMEVWVRADLPHRTLLLVLAHELRHSWQFKHGYPQDQEWFVLAHAERDADEYAENALTALQIA